MKNEEYRRHPARGSQRLPHAGRRLASCRLTKQRLINALAAEIDERAAFSEGTELLYSTKFRRCYRKACTYLRAGYAMRQKIVSTISIC